MNKLLATNILQNVIMGYCEDSVGSEEYEAERKQIDEAWEFMQKEPDSSRYEIRYDGGGDFSYWIFGPYNDELPYNDEDLKDVQDTLREAEILMGHKMWIVKITEERL